MIRKISCLVAVYLWVASLVFGQHNNEQSFVNMPPSPIASKFKIYTDNQPNFSSGSVNVPIDLFNLSIYNYSLPIQLTYSSSGINVMESPLPYGYGWQLNINPRVTRQLLGREDEKYPFKNSYDPNNSNWGARVAVNIGDFGEYYEPLKGIVNVQHNVAYQLVLADLFDPQKDIFTIQLPHRSVTFYLDWNNGQPVAKTFGNSVKINTAIANKRILGFEIVDEDGVFYRFGNVNGETGTNYEESYNVTLSWLLREIELTNKQKIYFNWVEKNVSSTKPSISNTVSINDWKLYDMGDGYDAEPTVDDVGGIVNIAEYSSNFSKMLSKIDFPLGTINFVYSTTKEPFVTEINLKDKNEEVIHKAIFSFGERNTAQDHLLLQSLKVDNQLYRFSYNQNRFSNGSTSLDFWGFFNGKVQNTHVPRVNLKKFNNYYHYTSQPYEFSGLTVGTADKSVDTAKMKALILEKVIYPTGGYTIYDYEPHRFTYAETYPGFYDSPITPTVGGGLRVKKILFYDKDNKLQLERSYTYGKNEDGLANIKLVPTMNSFIDEKFHFTYNYNGPGWSHVFSARNLTVKSLSDHSALDFGRSSFWYDQVVEYSTGGKIIREFVFRDDATSELERVKLFQKRYTSTINTLFQDGAKLSSETVLTKSGNVYDTISKKEFQYKYIVYPDFNVRNLLIDRRIFANNLGAFGPGVDVLYPSGDFWPYRFNSQTSQGAEFPRGELRFNIGYYTIMPGFHRLEGTKETLYSGGRKTISETTMEYDLTRPMYVISTQKVTSKSPVLQTKYRYVWNFSTAIAQLMLQKNMLNTPFETEQLLNQAVNVNKNIFSNEAAITTGLVLIKEKQEFANSVLKNISAISKFDQFGNPLEVREKSKGLITYLWGYLGTQPIIKVENASYGEVISALGVSSTSILAELNKLTVRDDYIKQVASSLRNHLSLKKALVSAYTYKPLVGLTSIVDVNGNGESYGYDTYGRLEYIKDIKGNLLKTFCYNNSGELIDCKIYLSTAQSQSFTKNDCLSGQIGSSVTYTVPAGTYMSTISQNDANQKALKDIQANGQNYANQQGTCTTPTVYVDVEILKETDWNGKISRISFYKNGSASQEFDVFPTNTGSSEYISVPEGEYSRIRINVDGTGTPYSGMLSIVNSNATVCQEIGMGNIEINLYNVKFQQNGNKRIVVAEYCMN